MRPKLLSQLRPWYDGLLSIFYPQLCVGCARNLFQSEDLLCRKCVTELPRTKFEMFSDNPVSQIFWGRVPLVFATAIFYYRKGEMIQNIIHRLKYRKNTNAGLFLGRLTGRILKESTWFMEPDLIVPVPLHEKKKRQRGYNQSEILAKGISEILNVPYDGNVVLRKVYGESQTRKSRYERWENVDESFVCGNLDEEVKHILLVDDVVTTGATLEACIAALQRSSNLKISVVTIGYAVR